MKTAQRITVDSPQNLTESALGVFPFLILALLLLLPLGCSQKPDRVKADLLTTPEKGPRLQTGVAIFTDMDNGVQVIVDLYGLSPGEYGFHVHEKPNCASARPGGQFVAAMAAGGHYDPAGTGKHLGPGQGGHLGDLPVLIIGPDGNVKAELIIAGLKAKDVRSRAVAIRAGGDNYSDAPHPLGGNGQITACGVAQ